MLGVLDSAGAETVTARVGGGACENPGVRRGARTLSERHGL